MKRREILEQAIQYCCHDRQDRHGKPENTFAMIADLWEMYLCHKYETDITIRSMDVAQMMVLFKIARSALGKTKDDDFVDAAGYSALSAELSENRPSETAYKAIIRAAEYQGMDTGCK